MKKTFIFGALALGSVMLSCSNDEESFDPSLLNRKWYHDKTKTLSFVYPYDGHETCGKDYIEFRADGSMLDVDVLNCESVTDNYTYTLSNKTISIRYLGNLQGSADIASLSASRLVLRTIGDYNGDGQAELIEEFYTAQ